MIYNSTLKKCFLTFLSFILIQSTLFATTYLSQDSSDDDCSSETAFAFLNADEDLLNPDEQSTCFIPEFNRWGWTTLLDFSAETGQSSYDLDIYAGAGQCDLSKGTDVGTVTVTYNNDNTVTFNYNLDGFLLTEAHVYIGSEPYPIKNNGTSTVAPGKYTHVDSDFDAANAYSVTLPFDENQFYVIIHGVTIAEDCIDSDDDCPDVDSDTVCDVDDICPDGDDTTDSDGDGIPDDCDYCPLDAANGCIGRIGEIPFDTYPVPFKNEVNIKYQFDYDTNVTIEIFTMNGVKIKEYKDSQYSRTSLKTAELDLSFVSSQLLFVRVTTAQGQSIKKIISSNLASN